MKQMVGNRFAVVVLVMIAVAVAAFLAAPKLEASGGGCKFQVCPSPPEGCTFLGCDSHGNCLYQC